MTVGLLAGFLFVGCNLDDAVIGPDDGRGPTDNLSPVANAGADVSVTDADENGNEPVTLNGSSSADADGTIATHIWTESGRFLAAGPSPVVTLPTGTHTITLAVTDNRGAPATDEVVVSVLEYTGNANRPPVADAGPDQVVVDDDGNGSEHFWVDPSGSHDPDGTIVSYRWTEGSSPVRVDGNNYTRLDQGTHTLTLTVVDDRGDSDSDTVTIRIVPAGSNLPPVANAGSDQTVDDLDGNGSEVVRLSGSATDADGSIASYEWSEGSSPLGSGSSANVTLAVGSHTITLKVTDNEGATGTDTVVITVLEVGGNQPPRANAGSDQSVSDTDGNGSETISLNGSGSSDPNGSIASYVWREGSTQLGTGSRPSVTLSVGTHTIVLTVTDNDGATDTDTVVITVNAPSNISYSRDIQPYFNQRCVSCHRNGGDGGADVDTWQHVMNGGRGGAMVVPGDSSTGTLMRKMRGGHKGAPHSTTATQDIASWIDAGALNN